MHEYWRAISRRDVLRAELIERRGARLQLGAREGRLFTPSRREQVARAAARRARVPRAGRARLPTRAEHQAQPGLLVHLPVEQLPLPRRYRAGDDGARRRAALLVRLLRHPLRQRQGGGGRLGRPARRRAGGRFGPPRAHRAPPPTALPPAGAQVVALPWQDERCLEAMAALEAALPADARRRATTPPGLFD